MPRRTPPEDLTPEERKAWSNAYKNRNLHSVKLSDELEADFQTWRIAKGFATDHAAIRYLIQSHPEL